MTSIELPSSLTRIGDGTFKDCTSLTFIKLPSSLTTIGHSAFWGCTGLTSIELPSSLKNIGGYAFWGCTGLTSIELINIVNLGDNVFNNCKVDIKGTPVISVTSFSNCDVYLNNENARFTAINATSSPSYTAIKFSGWDRHVENNNIYYKIGDTYYLYDIMDEVKGIAIQAGFDCEYYTTYLIIKKINPGTTVNISDWLGCVTLNRTTYTVKSNEKNTIYETFGDGFYITPALDKGDWKYDEAYYTFNNLPFHEGVKSSLFDIKQNQLSVILKNNNMVYSCTVVYDVPACPDPQFSNESAVATSTSSARLMADANLSTGCMCGIEWRRNGAPANVKPSEAPCPVVQGVMIGELRNLKDDVYYEFRPYYDDIDGKRWYGEWTGFFIGDANVYFKPEVTTYNAAPADAENSMVLTGMALSGSDVILEQGFEYRLTSAPKTRASEWERLNVSGIYMKAELHDLVAGGKYEYRSFARTAAETVYGEAVEFEVEDKSNDNTGIDAVEAESNNNLEFTLLNNPVIDSPKLKFNSNSEKVNVTIISMYGATVYQGVVNVKDEIVTLNVNLAPNLYLLVVDNGNERRTAKMVVK